MSVVRMRTNRTGSIACRCSKILASPIVVKYLADLSMFFCLLACALHMKSLL